MQVFSQWLFISEDRIMLKATLPFESIAYDRLWSDVVNVRVWSTQPPSVPGSHIKKIVVLPPYGPGKRIPCTLTITDKNPAIRQIMDLINAKVPDKVTWEVQ